MLKQIHPNQDIKRENWLNLNGEWEFAFDKPVYDKKITVPFSWTCELSGIYQNRSGTAYYRKSVKFEFSQRLFLVINACDFETEVFVNGVKAAEHIGGYGRIETDITNLWKKCEENIIEVKATDNDGKDQPVGKQAYGQTRGIWQTVYLEERGFSYISSFVINTVIDGAVSVKADIVSDKEYKFFAEFDGNIFSAEGNVINFNIENPKLWTTNEPNLYFGKLILEGEGFRDEVETYFGIREVGTTKINGINYITINNKPVYINALLDQSFNEKGHFTLPSDAECEKEILRLKDIGINAIRIHIKAEEPLKLYYADKHGILIIQDIPCFWGEPTDKAKAQFEKEMEEYILRDINHPSIFYWCIFNETWGLKHFDKQQEDKWEFRKETQEWIRKCYKKAKELDPTRLVEDNSPCNKDHVETDVFTWHFYTNGYERVKNQIKDITENCFEGSDYWFIGGNKCADVPIMNSECGNYWGIEGGAGASDISWQYKYMLNQFRLEEKICGFVFTEFHDVLCEFNGIYTIDGDLKQSNFSYFADGMEYNDLHSEDFLAIDYMPMESKAGGEKVCLPLYISSFTDENHGRVCKVEYRGILNEKVIETDVFECVFDSFGLTKICDYSVNIPDVNGIFVAEFTLKNQKGKIMKNYVLFDIIKENKKEIKLSAIKTEGFDRSFYVQQGNKLNCIGEGCAYIEINANKTKDAELIFEMSSRELFSREMKIDENKINDLALFTGGAVLQKGDNKNSYFMTDSILCPSKVEIFVNKKYLQTLDIKDSPADASGSLSWHHQADDEHLDEAGSYGYLYIITIPKEMLEEKTIIEFKTKNSLSFYGRKSGKYPVEIEIIQ